jgi:hypothetical protein
MKLKTKEKSFESVGCKCFRPGDPEFEALANLVTPLHKIRSEFSGKMTVFNVDKHRYGWKRNESVNDLYAGATYLSA